MRARCAVPTRAWWLYVAAHTPADGTGWLTPIPFSGLLARTINGDTGPTTTLWLRLAHYTEGVALAGIWLAIAVTALYFIITRWPEPAVLVPC